VIQKGRLPKGVWFQRKRLATGEVIRYGYFGRGAGTEALGREGSAEFHERLAAVMRREPEDGRVSKLVWRYKTSAEFGKLRDRTRADYSRQLDKISAKFGKLSLGAMASPAIADHIYTWRDTLAESSPRQADYAISVLSAMLTFGVRRGIISHNRASGVGDVYTADRREKVWTAELEAKLLDAESTPEPVRRAVVLAIESGLAQEDLLVLPLTAIREGVIVTRRLKNGSPVAIPVSPRLESVLASAPRGDAVAVLTKADGRPWDFKGNGIRSAFREACAAVGIEGLTFHDLRGTFITRRREQGWTAEEVALCSGHKISGEKGAQSAYVDRAAVALANAKRLAERHYGAKAEQNLQTGLQTADEPNEVSA
jgi:integrase